jgi:cytochrome c553
MKPIKSTLAILAILSAAAGPLSADETLRIGNCTWCHGSSAQGFMRAPRLAGQRDQYIENQLLSFQQHTRDNPRSQQYMWAAAANLAPETAHDLAAYFSTLPPQAANDGDATLAPAGRQIYEEGIAESNVVACVVCHGPNAEGVREIPRLGGLSYVYLKERLEQWGAGYHASAGPMPRIASTLSPDQIDALASYLSFVEYGSLN